MKESQSASEIVSSITKLLEDHASDNNSLDWIKGLINSTLDKIVAVDLENWAQRKERLKFNRYMSYYSPEWIVENLVTATQLLDQATAIRREYFQLESQGLILAIQYTLDVTQRPHIFEASRLQVQESCKVLGFDKKNTDKKIESVNTHENLLKDIHLLRQGLHGIDGGALNFSDRLDEIRLAYTETMKDLIDRTEAAHIGLCSTMRIAISEPPVSVFKNEKNATSEYREWLIDAKRQLTATQLSETQHRFIIFLKNDAYLPNLLEDLKQTNINDTKEFKFKINYPKLGNQIPAGVLGIYPIVINSHSLVANDGITKDNSHEYPFRLEKRNNDQNRQLRTSFTMTITPPLQSSVDSKYKWESTPRFHSNVLYAGENSIIGAVERSDGLAGMRVLPDGQFRLDVLGKAIFGTQSISVNTLIDDSTPEEFQIFDIALVIDAVYRDRDRVN